MIFKSFQHKFSLHYDDIHHIMIGIIFLLFFSWFSYIFTAVTLILEHATILFSSGRRQELALHQAQLKYLQFGQSSAKAQFPAAFQNYPDTEFTQFILNNRLPLHNNNNNNNNNKFDNNYYYNALLEAQEHF